jgi:FCD domain
MKSLKGKPTMYPRNIRDLQADGLFASAPQPGDPLSRIRQAIAVPLDAHGNVAAGTSGDRLTDDELIRVCAVAAHVACRRMTPRYLKALHASVEQACCLPSGFDWDRKAAAHAEVVNLLADAAGEPPLTVLVRDVSGQLHDLMVVVGPAASGIIAGSRHRLLTLLRAGDADGAAREMEQHLGGLLWMRRAFRRPARNAVQTDIAV